MEFLVSRTYDIVTEESAREGDFAESGFVSQDERMTLREVIRELEGMTETSCWPIRCPEDCEHVWMTGEPEIDYRTGDETTESVHLKTVTGGDVPGHIMFRILKLAGLVTR